MLLSVLASVHPDTTRRWKHSSGMVHSTRAAKLIEAHTTVLVEFGDEASESVVVHSSLFQTIFETQLKASGRCIGALSSHSAADNALRVWLQLDEAWRGEHQGGSRHCDARSVGQQRQAKARVHDCMKTFGTPRERVMNLDETLFGPSLPHRELLCGVAQGSMCDRSLCAFTLVSCFIARHTAPCEYVSCQKKCDSSLAARRACPQHSRFRGTLRVSLSSRRSSRA